MKKKQTKLDIDKILKSYSKGPSKWELDNITWYDRSTNPKTLVDFLNRIKELEEKTKLSQEEANELLLLNELAADLDEEECMTLLSTDEEFARHNFIESLARKSA